MTGEVGATTPAGTNGFLFCDLRGYTAFVERRGDQAAAELLATYRELVRAVIAAHDGAEIKTEGDSVYVVFPAASAAVEAGLGIVAGAAERSTAERPIRVGVGIHAGETVATTEGLVGGAVNIAARVCAKAQAGEVLVTDTVRALTRTFLPYTYTSLGTHQLKGIAGGIPLYRVEAVPSTGRARIARQLGARRGRLAILAGLVVVALVAATGVYALNRPADCLTLPASTKDVVARIDPARKCVVATYAVGQRPGTIAISGDGDLWIANVDSWTATRIDVRTGSSLTTGTVGSPIDLVLDTLDNPVVLVKLLGTGEDLHNDWVAVIDHRVNRITDLAALPRTLPDRAGTAAPSGITYTAERAWVSDVGLSVVHRVALGQTGPGMVTMAVGATEGDQKTGPGPIDAGGGLVWLADTLAPTIYRIEGLQAVEIALQGSAPSTTIDATDRAVWLGRTDGRLTRYDPASRLQTTWPSIESIQAIAAGADAVWLADGRASRLVRVDPKTGAQVSTIDIGGRPADVALAPDGSLWVTIQAP